jgi:hypothetical protein
MAYTPIINLGFLPIQGMYYIGNLLSPHPPSPVIFIIDFKLEVLQTFHLSEGHSVW